MINYISWHGKSWEMTDTSILKIISRKALCLNSCNKTSTKQNDFSYPKTMPYRPWCLKVLKKKGSFNVHIATDGQVPTRWELSLDDSIIESFSKWFINLYQGMVSSAWCVLTKYTPEIDTIITTILTRWKLRHRKFKGLTHNQ